MEFVKKHILNLTCAAVALLSMLAIFWPISGQYDEINAKLQTSKKLDQQLRTAISNGDSRHLPIVDLNSTKAPELQGFPTQRVYDLGRTVVEKMAARSKQLMDKAIQENSRQPLEPDSLPSFRRGGIAAVIFKQKYFNQMEALKRTLNALPPPTADDVQAEQQQIWNTKWLPNLPAASEQTKQAQLQEMQERFKAEVLPTLPAVVSITRAKQCSMYISSTGLDLSPGIPPMSDPTPPTVDAIWAAQLGLWIQEDIVRAIAETNRQFGRTDGGAVTVPGAVVKRLVRTEIEPAYVTADGPVQLISTTGGAPVAPVRSDNNNGQMPGMQPAQTGVIRSYEQAFTGRVSNSVYDVMHFSFTVDIDAGYCQTLMASLSNGRFITVLDVGMTALDRGACQRAGLIYGNRPVVQMTVHGEAIFFRVWAKKLMPHSVKVMMQIDQDAQNPVASGY